MDFRNKIILSYLTPLLILIVYFGGGYYFFRQESLIDNSARWLDTRMEDALTVISKHEGIIQKYGLNGIVASVVKAKLDAMEELSEIKISEHGFIFITDHHGAVVLHPDKYFIGSDASEEKWFISITGQPREKNFKTSESRPPLILNIRGKKYLAQVHFFAPWEWYVIAADPEKSLWRSIEKPLFILLGPGTLVIALCAWFVYYRTRKLIDPLDRLAAQLEKAAGTPQQTHRSDFTIHEFSTLSSALNRFIASTGNHLQALRTENEFLSTISRNSIDLVTVIDPNKKLTYVSTSASRILGRNPIEMVGRSLIDFIDDAEKPLLDEHLRLAALSDVSAPPAEIRLRHKDGRWCILEAVSRRIQSAANGSSCFVTFSRNIDRRKYAQAMADRSHTQLLEKFEQSLHQIDALNVQLDAETNKRLSAQAAADDIRRSAAKLLADVNVDIKKDLTAVFGFTGFADCAAMDKTTRTLLSMARQSAENILKRTNDMTLLNELLFRNLSAHATCVNIRQIFDLLTQKYKNHIIKKPVVLICDIDPFFPECIYLDRIFLQQILYSLMDLAFESTASGSIRLSARYTPRPDAPGQADLTFSLELLNHQIPHSLLTKISRCRNKSEKSLYWPEDDLDPALFNSCHLLHLMGGELTIDQKDAKTAKFDLFFPGHETSGREIPDDTLVDVSTLDFKESVALIVDTNSSAAHTLSLLLEELKITVRTCDTCSGMIRIIETGRPDLVFINYDFATNPEIFDFSRAQHLLRAKGLKVIGMTTNIAECRAQQPENKLFSEMICMPFQPAQLYALIGRHIEPRTVAPSDRWKPDIVLSTSMLQAKCIEDEDFRNAFNTRLAFRIPQFGHGINMTDIRSFGMEIINTGQAHQFPELVRIGEILTSLSQNFDIEKIRICLEEIDNIFNHAMKAS